jgi:hypothetical protein
VSSTAVWILAGVGLLVGVLALAISSAMLRSVREEEHAETAGMQLSWPQFVDESLRAADAQLRTDIAERLAIVNTAWSREILQRAQREERDPQVRAAIDAGLAASSPGPDS